MACIYLLNSRGGPQSFDLTSHILYPIIVREGLFKKVKKWISHCILKSCVEEFQGFFSSQEANFFAKWLVFTEVLILTSHIFIQLQLPPTIRPIRPPIRPIRPPIRPWIRLIIPLFIPIRPPIRLIRPLIRPIRPLI